MANPTLSMPGTAAPVAATPPAPTKPATLSVRLLYDTWVGDERIACAAKTSDHGLKVIEYNIVDLPFDHAVKLLQEKKAERADPLPTS